MKQKGTKEEDAEVSEESNGRLDRYSVRED